MRSSRIAIIIALVVSLGLFLGVSTAAAAAEDDVKAAMKAYFGAAAKGDLETMKKMSLGKAAQNLPKKATKGYKMMMMMGAAYEKAVDVKVAGEKAMGTAVFNLAAMQKALSAMAMDDLAKMKDPKKRAQAEKMMKQMIPQLAQRMSRVPVQLVKKGGQWMISGFRK
jgi:hypothetical protein